MLALSAYYRVTHEKQIRCLKRINAIGVGEKKERETFGETLGNP